MKILVLPKDNYNPYQSLLYNEMQSFGVRIAYAARLTPSYTLNLLLLPMETVARRITGTRLAHIHWTFGFGIYGESRFPFLRRVAQDWFYLWLWVVRITGMRLVWTAHNVLPIVPRFADDVAARRRLVGAADLVIFHSRATLAELAEFGIVPRNSVVIPHGPYEVAREREHLRIPASTPGPRKFLFFGAVEEYKGVDTLLTAFTELPPDLDAQLMVAGECGDSSLKALLYELAHRSSRSIELRLERIPDGEVSKLLESADAIVLPYRRSSTSGSALLALSHGRPLVLPDLPGLAELPDNAIIRYDGTTQGLTNALVDLARADTAVFTKMSDAGYTYCASLSWESIAQATFNAMSLLLWHRRGRRSGQVSIREPKGNLWNCGLRRRSLTKINSCARNPAGENGSAKSDR
jgi:glycosyltransferase involved in cell wall biosynthesis